MIECHRFYCVDFLSWFIEDIHHSVFLTLLFGHPFKSTAATIPKSLVFGHWPNVQ